MALPDVIFNIGQGGLGTPLPGQDYISAMMVYNNSLPSGYSTSKRIIQFFSISDAENNGITTNNSDATAASGGGFTVSAIGTNGDTLTVTFTNPDGTITILGTYTKVTGDTTVTLVAAGVVTAINAGTSTHGFTATNTAGAITITATKALGAWPNSKGVTVVLSSGATITTGTPTTFANGVGSLLSIYHYHINQFFIVNPGASLYFGIFAVPGGTYDFSEVTTMQNFSNGVIRQIGVYIPEKTLADALVTALQSVLTTNETNHAPLVAILTADISTVSDLSTLSDESQLTAKYVSVDIGQDGAGTGNALYLTTGKSIGSLGAALGSESLVNVGTSIAYPEEVNLVVGSEFDTAAFSNGQLWRNIAPSLLILLDNYKYLFLRKIIGVTGTFFMRDSTAVSNTSAFARIRNARTIQKASRLIYAAYAPKLFAPLLINQDGTLGQDTIDQFITLGEGALQVMKNNQEISQREVIINAAQDVLSTNTLVITVNIIPLGAAESISVNIGFVKAF